MTHKPHLPPPASPSRSPEPMKAPSPSPLSVSEYLDTISADGGGSGDVRKEAVVGEDRGAGGGMRVEGLGLRGLDSSDLEDSVSDIGTLSPAGSVQGQSIHELERRLAVRATLDSLWGSSWGKGGFDPIVVDGEDVFGELVLEKGEEQIERGRGEQLEKVRGVEVDKQNKTNWDGGKARASMPKHESEGVSSSRNSEQAHRSQGRHHCLLDGHLFKERGVEAIGERGYKQKTKNKIEEKTIKCWGCSEKIAEEQSWVCEVEVCGMVACRGCVKRWEKERKKRVVAGQKGVMEWLGS